MFRNPLEDRGGEGLQHVHYVFFNATEPLHSWGSPTKGTKSELAASPMPSRGPKRGWKCCITLHSWGSPTKGIKSKHKTKQKSMNFFATVSLILHQVLQISRIED